VATSPYWSSTPEVSGADVAQTGFACVAPRPATTGVGPVTTNALSPLATPRHAARLSTSTTLKWDEPVWPGAATQARSLLACPCVVGPKIHAAPGRAEEISVSGDEPVRAGLNVFARQPLGRGGLSVGRLSCGGAPLGNLGTRVDPVVAQAALARAWKSGIRYFDVAPHYGLGLAERRLGEALSGFDRNEFVVSTKVGRLLTPRDNANGELDEEEFDVRADYHRTRDYSRDGVLRSVEDSLERMGLSRMDILFVHDPDDYYREAMEGAFPALEELRSQGVISSYGAGMNQADMLDDFVRNTDLDVVLLAGRYSLFEQDALDTLLPHATERGVSVVAGGVFNSGLLAENRPAPGITYNYEPAPAAVLERVNRIADVCEAHGVALPAAAIQFPLAHPAIATVCVGVRAPEHIDRNLELFDVDIPGALWQDLVSEGLLRADAPVPAGMPAGAGDGR
jgi:D-threo-aldose 1-dehydrogenase